MPTRLTVSSTEHYFLSKLIVETLVSPASNILPCFLLAFFCGMRVVNTYAVYYQSQNPKKCLETAEREKKKKYLYACLNECRHFTPFFASVDGLLRVEAEATIKSLASRLRTKWKDPYSHTCRYVKSRLAITLVSSNHHCIRGGQGTGVPNQCDLYPVVGRLGPPPLPVRRGSHPFLFSLLTPLFPFPLQGEGTNAQGV